MVKNKKDEKSKLSLSAALNKAGLGQEAVPNLCSMPMDPNAFIDEKEVQLGVLQYMAHVMKFGLLDFGHCIKESRTLKIEIRDNYTQFNSYEKSFDNLESLVKKYISLMKPVTALKAKFIATLNDSLANPSDKNIATILGSFNFESGSEMGTDDDFYVKFLQEMIDEHKAMFKVLKRVHSEYEKTAIVFDSNMQRKNAYSPVAKSAGRGHDVESNDAAKAFFLAQLDLALVFNKFKILKEFTPCRISNGLISTLDPKSEARRTLEFNKKVIEDQIRCSYKINENVEFIYQWYRQCIELDDIREYMLGLPEGYMETKRPGQTGFSKKNWVFIESSSMVEFNKKTNQNNVLIKNINKTAFKPSSDTGDLLTFECLDQGGVTQFRCNTETDRTMWLKGLEAMKQNANMADSIHTGSGNSSDILENLKGQMSKKRASLLPGAMVIREDKIALSILGNKKCADCVKNETEWLSLNLGICICINCSGKHRRLGTQLSKVRSLVMDDLDPLTIKMMVELGNIQCNVINEYQLQNGHFSGVDRSDLSFFKCKYDTTNYEPKNINEWEDCATKYIHSIKQCHPKDNLSHDLELFSKLVGEKKVEIDDLAKFSQVTYVYFLLRKNKSTKYSQNEISKLIPKCIRLKTGTILAYLFYSGVTLHYGEDSGNNIAKLAKEEGYSDMVEFLKANYLIKGL